LKVNSTWFMTFAKSFAERTLLVLRSAKARALVASRPRVERREVTA